MGRSRLVKPIPLYTKALPEEEVVHCPSALWSEHRIII